MKKFLSIPRLLKSFGYALKGILHAFTKEPNAQIHLLAVVVMTCAGFYFNISSTEWLVQILLMAAIVSAELFNTAIEKLVDLLHPEKDPKAGIIKDLAAGAVLLLALAAVIIGYLIYWDKITALF